MADDASVVVGSRLLCLGNSEHPKLTLCLGELALSISWTGLNPKASDAAQDSFSSCSGGWLHFLTRLKVWRSHMQV